MSKALEVIKTKDGPIIAIAIRHSHPKQVRHTLSRYWPEFEGWNFSVYGKIRNPNKTFLALYPKSISFTDAWINTVAGTRQALLPKTTGTAELKTSEQSGKPELRLTSGPYIDRFSFLDITEETKYLSSFRANLGQTNISQMVTIR